MDLLFVLTGVVLIVIVFWDIFRTLFYPAEKGSASRVIAGVFWRGSSRPAVRGLAGPAAFLAVAGGWFALLALGWALVCHGGNPRCSVLRRSAMIKPLRSIQNERLSD